MTGIWTWVLTTLLVQAQAAPPYQIPFPEPESESFPHDSPGPARIERPLQGRFLQITDFHPDRFYQVYASTSEDAACHRGQGPAGIYGAETSECDSPVDLVNKTMEYVAAEFKDKIDFVIWTGDSARHDNDELLPRSREQVIGLNELMVQKMFEVFGKRNGDEDDEDPNNDYTIPIVPNLGNNDILPHNIMARGPNRWTRTYSKVWRQFIPEAQKHQFEQGGWFYVEVIPNKLAVFSLNTLFFFASNAAADGCAVKSEPGYQQMEWLRIQLQFMRDRGMKAILIGHVPPARQDAKTQWDETCWQKYALWNRQYRDVIVSSHYGHFNYDHFILQDFKQIDKDTKHGLMEYYYADRKDDLSAKLKSDYWLQMREEWAGLPDPPASSSGKKGKKKQDRYLKKIGGEYAERFSASFVNPSVVPNLFPTLRIYEYNITGLAASQHDSIAPPPPAPFETDNDITMQKKKHKKYKFTVPDAPSKSAPPGPAYSPQTLSLLKYTQYFANLTHINNDFASAPAGDTNNVDIAKWKEGKHKGRKPHDRDHAPDPKTFKFEMYYDTREDEVYHLKDLTMPSLVELATRIGDFESEEEEEEAKEAKVNEEDEEGVESSKKTHKGHKKHRKHHKENEAWYTFIRRVFIETKGPDEIDEEFGH